MIGRILGHYKILDLLGAGGMGEVYRAEDTTLGREVAIKVLPAQFTEDSERLARFEREAKLLATLNHPHIAQIHSLEEVDGQKLLVMELVDGETLSELIARGPRSLEDSLPIGLQIAEALEAAHERGIVHRDLKPANIKVTPQGNVKVLDFGLAKPITDSASSDLSHSPTLTYSPTQAGVLLGTAAYMSPEQARGQEVDKRTDIWAFGVVLWGMLTGQRLFDGATVSDVLAAVLRAEPDWALLPRDTPRSIRRLLRRCLTRDPNDRLHDIADARLELSEEADSVGLDVDESTAIGTSWMWKAVAAALLLSTLILGSLLLSQPKDQEPKAVFATLPRPPGPHYLMTGFQPGPPVLSPNGEFLAFTAREPDDPAKLWIRSVADGTASVLPETDGAFLPFWSPDSRALAFFSDGMLRSISLEGGPALPITDAPFGKGGSWNRRDVIVFTPGFGDGIYRVAVGGGLAEAVTEIDSESHVWTHRLPHFLPDGEHFLFVAGKDDGKWEVHLGSLAAEPSRLILESDSAALYASGHVLFVRDGTLLAQPFKLDDQSLAGRALPLASGVSEFFSHVAAFTSSGTGRLAYLPSSTSPLPRLAWVDRAGGRTYIDEGPADYSGFRLSPDGTQIAVSVTEPGSGETDIWLIEAAGGKRRRVTFDSGDEDAPVWSPHGSRLAFTESAAEARQGRLVVQSLGSTRDREVLLEPGEQLLPIAESWSPDGSWLAYHILNSTTSEISGWLLPLEPRGEPIRYRDPAKASPFGSFSPDGRWLAYTVFEERVPQIYVTSFPDRQRRWRVSSEAGIFPAWGAEGRSLLFFGGAGELLEAQLTTSGGEFGWESPRQVLPPDQFYSYSTPDLHGDRFLQLVAEEPTDGAVPLTLILNWPTLLKDFS